MSCKEGWTRVAEQLGGQGFVPKTGVNAGPTCIQPECSARVNLATGKCLFGHSQGMELIEGSTASTDIVQAMLCMVGDLGPAADFTIPYIQEQLETYVATSPAARTPEIESGLTQAVGDWLMVLQRRPRAAAWDDDPRVQVAHAFVQQRRWREMGESFVQAQGAQRRGDVAAAWDSYQQAFDLAYSLHDVQGEVRAQQGLRELFPISLRDAADIVREYVRTTLELSVSCSAIESREAGVYIPMTGDLSEEERQALQQLGFGPSVDRLYLELGMAQVATLVNERRLEARKDWEMLYEAYKALQATSALSRQPGLSQEQALGKQAVSVWQESFATWERHRQVFRAEGLGFEPVSDAVTEMRDAAAEVLIKLPVIQLARALAKAGLVEPGQRKDIAIYRYSGMRNAALTNRWGENILPLLPQLSRDAQSRAGAYRILLRLQETMQGRDSHSIQPEDLDFLAQIGEELGKSEAPWEGGANYHQAVAGMTDILVATEEPLPKPYSTMTKSGAAHSLYTDLWDDVAAQTATFPLQRLRELGKKRGMPNAPYANRKEIVGYFRATSPFARRETVVGIATRLARQKRKSLRATDSTGKSRTYRLGDTVSVPREGLGNRGTVEQCFFGLPEGGSEVVPSVRIHLGTMGTGPVVERPISEIEMSQHGAT